MTCNQLKLILFLYVLLTKNIRTVSFNFFFTCSTVKIPTFMLHFVSVARVAFAKFASFKAVADADA